jgi:type I restriction enzyme S subunit
VSKYSAYSVYKDSGVEWLGEVPEHWEIRKLKFSATLISNKINAKDSELQFIGLENIESFTGKLIFSDTESEGIALYYKDNDILFCKLRPYLAKVYLANQEGLCTSELLVLRGTEIIPPFLKYYLLSQEFINIVDSSTYGSKMPRANWEFIGNLSCLIPHEKEQHQIATFLDNKTAHLDKLIEKKQQMIGLLNEKRIALITQAVTKGLDLTVPMKDSGIEWLGEVPEHWVVNNINYVLNAIGDVDHYMPRSVEKGIPYVMTGDLKEFVSSINFKDCKQVSYEDYMKLSKKIKSSKGDLIVARYATIGTASYVDIDADFLVSYSCVTIKPNLSKALGLYLFYYFKSNAFLQGIQNEINTNTQGNVGINDLKKVTIALPTLAEQSKIVDYFNHETAKLDRMINTIQSAIAKLQEYRSALITAAVTGKIDVRTLTANEG